MKSFLDSLNILSSSKHVLQPDYTIQSLLLTFPSSDLISEEISSQEIEKALLNLLNVNNGDLAPQTGQHIGELLVSKVYEKDEKKHIWNLILMVSEKPNKGNIIALKYVVGKLGKYSKSSLSNVTKVLIGLKSENLVYSALLALRTLFKVCGETIEQNVNAAFNLAKSKLTSADEKVQIASIRLIQVLILKFKIDERKLIGFIQLAMENSKSNFVSYTINQLISLNAVSLIPNALCDSSSISAQNTNDFSITKEGEKDKSLEKAFEFILLFKENLSEILKLFILYLPQKYVYLNVKPIFNFIAENVQSEVFSLTCLFSNDLRYILYKMVYEKKPVNTNLLIDLTYDCESARTTAVICHGLSWSKIGVQRAASRDFFNTLTIKYPDVAKESIHLVLQYLALPPESSPTLLDEILGMASTANVLFTQIPEIDSKEDIILLKQFIQTAILNCKNEITYLKALLLVLEPLNSTIFDDLNVQETINYYIKKIINDKSYNEIKLIESILVYCSSHIEEISFLKEYMEFCFSKASSLSSAGIISLLKLASKIDVSNIFIYNLITFCINNYSTREITNNIISPKLKFLENDLNIIQYNLYSLSELTPISSFHISKNLFLKMVAEYIPKIYIKLGKKEIISTFNLIKEKISSKYIQFIVLLLYIDEESVLKIPNDFHIILLNHINQVSNLKSMEMLAKCIGIHLSKFRKSSNEIYKYTKQNNTIQTCLIESSIILYNNLSEREIVDFLVGATIRLNNKEISKFALNELSIIYDKKAVEITSMMIGEQQIQQFLSYIYQTPSLSVNHYCLIYNCYVKLLPILIPFIQSNSVQNLLLMELQSLLYSQIPFCKKLFLDLYRSVFAFSKEIAYFYPIKIPVSKYKEINYRLSALGAISDRSRIIPYKENNVMIIPIFYNFLQITKDKRVNDFIISNAEQFAKTPISQIKVDDLIKWFNITKQILSNNSMFDYGNIIVEPNETVKKSALILIDHLFPLIVEFKPLQTSCLDDIMTSVIRCIETKVPDLLKISYIIITKVFTNFNNYKTENGIRLLSLYDPQFSIASRFAFPNYVDISAEFLLNYVDFCFEDYDKNPESFSVLIKNYIKGLQMMDQKAQGFYEIATKLCRIAMKEKNIFEIYIDFYSKLPSLFSEIIIKTIKLRTTKNGWKELSEYRKQISPFYSDLLTSYVWLKNNFQINDNIDYQTMSSFFIMELTSCSESWRIYGGFSALIEILHYFNNKIDLEILKLIIDSMINICKNYSILLSPLIPNFILYATRVIKENSDIWNSIAYTVLNHRCYAESIGLIIKNCPNCIIIPSICSFVDFIIKEQNENIISIEQGLCLITLIYEKSNDCIPSVLYHLFESELKTDPDFLIIAYQRAIFRKETFVVIDKVSNFFILNINEKTLNYIAQIILHQPKVGIELLKRGLLVKIMNEYHNIDCFKFLHFLEIICNYFDENVVQEIMRESLDLLLLNGTNTKNITYIVVHIIKKCDLRYPHLSELVFNSFGTDEKNKIINIIQKLTVTKKVQKISLKTFSSNTRKRSNDEWNELEIVE